MKNAVIDLGFGDGGKGNFTAYLCSISPNPIVYRYSGGHQAGHTVVKDDVRHIFSSFGSGTLQGMPTYWSKNCTFYPRAFLNELDVLNEKGITPTIYVDAECPVTTFCDVSHNKRMEAKNEHGSCGVGFGATIEREEKYYSLVVMDLMFPEVLHHKLHEIMRYYNTDMGIIEQYYDEFMRNCKEVLKHIKIVNRFEQTGSYDTVIYEGSQGLMLDKNIGYFPHVTRGNVGSKALDDEIDEVYYITRAYQTRHGNGPMSNEHIRHNITENPNETNVTNYQGKFRRTLLDVGLLQYAMLRDMHDQTAKKVSLVITCLDHMENDWRFTYNGEIHHCLNEKDFIKKIIDIMCVNRVYISKSEDFQNIRKWENVITTD